LFEDWWLYTKAGIAAIVERMIKETEFSLALKMFVSCIDANLREAWQSFRFCNLQS